MSRGHNMKEFNFIDIVSDPSPTLLSTFFHSLRNSVYVIISVLHFLLLPLMATYQSIWPKGYDRTVKPEAEEFYWHPGGDPKSGVLMIHGFGSTPQIFREYGKQFLEDGYIVYGIRIIGHGSSEAHLADTLPIDWYLSVRDKYRELQAQCEEVHIVGHSLGSLNALILASIYPIKSLVLLSCPIKIRRTPLFRAHFLLRPLSVVIKYWPVGREKRRKLKEFGIHQYQKNPLKAVEGLFEIAEVTRERLPKVTCPVLAMVGDDDEYVELSTLDLLESNLSVSEFSTWVAPNAGHLIIETSEKTILDKKIHDWVIDHDQ